MHVSPVNWVNLFFMILQMIVTYKYVGDIYQNIRPLKQTYIHKLIIHNHRYHHSPLVKSFQEQACLLN